MLKQRVITAIILAILFLSALFLLPATGWAILVVLMVVQGAREWTTLSAMRPPSSFAYIGIMLVLSAMMLWIYTGLEAQQKHLLQMIVYGVATVFWLAIVPLWLANIWRSKNSLVLGVIGALVLLPTALAMMDLHAAQPQPWWLLGVMALVWIADIAAYFTGRKFGKNKLAPAVSPGKTWEGAYGATAGVLLYVLVLLLSGILHNYILLLLAIGATALSIIGDLFESAIKRQAGVKDSGNLLPGHGGLLDRIDALTSTLPVVSILLIILDLLK